MLDIGQSLEAFLASRIASRPPSIPFYSSVMAEQVTSSGSLDGAYWRRNFESPVLFNSAVRKLLDDHGKTPQLFLEVGPHGALAGPVRQIMTACNRTTDSYLSAMTRGKDCSESILKLAGELFLQHAPIHFAEIAPTARVLTDLPLYPWRHDKEYWAESRISREWRLRKFPHHELLGSRILEGNSLEPHWRNVLRLEDVAWLRDHQIGEDIVFPCAGYLAMAIESARQTSPDQVSGWTLRNVLVQSALVLSDTKPIEMITSLRPVRLTNTLNSTWWDFSVISYNEHTWTKHCIGQIKPESTPVGIRHSVDVSQKYLRPVESPYTSMRKIGLNYGPHFQGLVQASCLPNEKKASATLSQSAVSESKYAVHPTSIDHCLQLILLASCKGLLQRVTDLYVPTGIENLYVSDVETSEGARVHASVEASSANVLSGSTIATSDTGTFLSLTGGKFSSLETDLSIDTDRVAAAQLDWKPHFDLADMHSLVRPSEASSVDSAELELVEKLTLLSILEIRDRVSGISITSEHLKKFSAWIQAQGVRAQDGQYGLVSGCAQLAALNRDDRLHQILDLREQISRTGAYSAGELISRIVDCCEDILEGKIEGIEVLQPGDGLTNYYDFFESRTDSIDFFTVAGHSNPILRVLEIGAGTGGGTSVILKGLTRGGGGCERMYSSYTYTDISSGFFVAAQERFRQYAGIDFKVLDITKDPDKQGFDSGSFDLVIACNVLHATPSLHETLTHVRKLLAPGGCLFLQELSPQMKMVNL